MKTDRLKKLLVEAAKKNNGSQAKSILVEALKEKELKQFENAIEPIIKRNIPEPKEPTDTRLLALIKPEVARVVGDNMPTDEHFLRLIRPLIPQVKDGKSPKIEDVVRQVIAKLDLKEIDRMELVYAFDEKFNKLAQDLEEDKKEKKQLDSKFRSIDEQIKDIERRQEIVNSKGSSGKYAREIPVDTTNFAGNLSSADDTVQKALETLDDAVTGSSAFTGLTDTPSSYTGQAGKFAKVKATEDGLEFGSGDGIGDMLKATYDTDGDGIVDNAEALQGHPASDFAPALGTDDNYVTDAEKAALHSHSNKAVLDATTASFTTADETKLDGIAAGAEVNVNADWNASSGDAQILNKPTLATVATTGAYSDLSGKPTLGTAAALNTGTTNGTIPVLGADDKLNSALIPDLAITEFLGNFTNLTAALADAGVNVSQKGDWFTTDEDKSYIVTTNNPTLSTHVTQLKTPTGGVSSVFSRTGAITAQSGDYTTAQVTEVTNLYFTDARALAAAPAETTTTVGSLISGATGKTTPVDADAIGLSDSAASNVLKSLTWANVKATLKTYFDTKYQATGSYLLNVVEDTNPQLGGNLDVNGKTITSASNGNINVAPNGTGDVIFNTNQLYVDTSSGHIGIGTATPTRNAGSAGRVLDFTASVGTAGIVAHSGGIESSWLINNGLGVYYDASGATDYNNNFIQFRLGDTNSNYTSLKSIMRLQPTGKVGIGTVSPNAMFDVVSTTPALSSAGTSDVFTIALPTNPAVSYPQAATLAVGTHQTHGGTTPYSRLDIKLKAAANTTVAGDTTVMTLLDNGNVGIGTTTPTAYLHIKAGTATANTAPIKLTAGTLNTTPEAGAIEFDGTDFYFTI